ncbi:MAG: hypothetical protein QOH67_1444 [Hyphomicrobiales bacterium]|jgi:hypothetical protein|nr:hypothetical protein [Hyphomicrobiales bacterium]
MGLSVRQSAAGRAMLAGVLLVLTSQAVAQSITDKLGNWLFGPSSSSSASGDTANANTAAEVDCPGVDVRQGASTLAITAPGAEGGPLTTRYQVSIAQTARECAALGGVMTMKVGVQGRVLLGPSGGPGQVDIPLRMAVVQEGPAPKTVVTRFYKLAVAVGPGQVSVPFTHVEQDLTFPMPRAADFDAYVVYVGFDPASLNTKPERKPAKQKRK